MGWFDPLGLPTPRGFRHGPFRGIALILWRCRNIGGNGIDRSPEGDDDDGDGDAADDDDDRHKANADEGRTRSNRRLVSAMSLRRRAVERAIDYPQNTRVSQDLRVGQVKDGQRYRHRTPQGQLAILQNVVQGPQGHVGPDLLCAGV